MINKSPNDKRVYQYHTLANGLRVLLIEDHETKKSAASLVVNAGHFDDPDDCAGLAHFIEHMLFLGTKKHPSPDGYAKFISSHGGHHNAWTSSEHTNFFFDIKAEFLESALAQFSQFFICPLFNPEFINKERQAIESEFQLKLKDDLRRLYQVHKETCNPAHPFSRFSVGNLTTLIDNEKLTLKQRLHGFFEQHYQAHHMTLAVSAPIAISEQLKWVEKYFSAIKTDHQIKAKITTPLYLPQHLGQLITMQTLKQTQQLIFSFALEGVEQRYRDKSICYFSYLLGHEGEGSLLSYLRDLGLAHSLSAGGGIDASNFKDFNISIQLTQEGTQAMEPICNIVFAYLNFVKKKPWLTHIYPEKKQLAELAFRYQESIKPIDLVSSLSMNMQHYSSQDILTGDYMMQGLDEHWLVQISAALVPQNMRLIQLTDAGQADNYPNVCQWYNAPYRVVSLPAQFLDGLAMSEADDEFKYPAPNDFIPARTESLPLTKISSEPEKLIDEKGLVVWFKQDKTFKLPKSHIYLSFDLPNSQGSIKNIAFTRLFIEVFIDSVIEKNYPAEAAGLHYHVYPHQAGMTLHISGFSDKQPLLIEKLIQQMGSCDFDPQHFEMVRQRVIQSWKNTNKGKPISKLFSLLGCIYQNNQYQNKDLAEVLTTCDWHNFLVFVQQLFSEIHLEIMLYGDCQQEILATITSQVKTHLLTNNQASDEIPRIVYLQNKQQEAHLSVNTEHPDQCVILYYQADEISDFNTALYTLANQIISPLFFHELRTEQQLGYMLGTGYMPINQCPGFIAYIQSNKTHAAELISAMDLFFTTLVDHVKQITDEEWLNMKAGLSHQLLEKDTSMRIKAQRFWMAIGLKDTNFKRRERIAMALNAIEKTQIIAFIETTLTAENKSRLILSSQNEGDTASFKKFNFTPFGDIEKFQQAAKYIKLN